MVLQSTTFIFTAGEHLLNGYKGVEESRAASPLRPPSAVLYLLTTASLRLIFDPNLMFLCYTASGIVQNQHIAHI